MNKCFLTDSTEHLAIISVDGLDYHYDESKFGDLSVNTLKTKIREKKSAQSSKLDSLAKAFEIEAKNHGISIDELILKITGGKGIAHNTVAEQPTTPVQRPLAPLVGKPAPTTAVSDDGFKPIDGSIVSTIKANVVAEEGVSGAMPGHSLPVVEKNKKAKIVDGTAITKGEFGETQIIIRNVNSKDTDNQLRTVQDYELVHHAKKSRQCPLCKGSGITIGRQCGKCKGAGIITIA